MALRHAVLAALLEGEASGYDLSRRFDVSVANFWTATPQQVYRELERLEAAGLLSARVVMQERRPNKRLFALTEAGRSELFEFTARPARPTTLRDELLVKLQAVDAGDLDAVRAAVTERMDQATRKVEAWERLRERILRGATEEHFIANTDRVGPYLTLMRGIAFERETLEWARAVLEVLSRRSQRTAMDPSRNQAAI